eukprot:superscaffoldBa00009279_g23987
MASLQSVLLASSIIHLYWTIASTQSHDPTNFSQCYRVKRDPVPGSKDQADKILNTVKDSLSVFKDVMEKIDTKKVSAVMQGLASFASVAPGIGGLVSSIINMVLVFILRDDLVLIEVKKGFAEVNRKLDSLSIQLSSLTADMEWFNYASVYSQDEMRILNAWKKFNEFRENSELVQSQEDKLRLAEIFTNYFEHTATETSVTNLYHYLTVNSTSGNLNDLLRKKFKCDISEIAKYYFYFSSLLWKGMVLNQLYWSLIGFNSSGKEAQHTQMFKDVYRAQLSAVEFCLDNYEQYMKEDVVKISKEISPDKKQDIAEKVKKALDEKYNWYSWMVLVYNTDVEENIFILFDVTKIPVGEITVAVGYTLIADETLSQDLKDLADTCLKDFRPPHPTVSAVSVASPGKLPATYMLRSPGPAPALPAAPLPVRHLHNQGQLRTISSPSLCQQQQSRSGHQPTKLLDHWNSMKNAGHQMIPNITLSPLEPPEDGAWE